MRRYRGHEQKYFLIYSCFGGKRDEYLATGSEDNTVYIYHREKETPITKLDGHCKYLSFSVFFTLIFRYKSYLCLVKAVTCVDWHPHQAGLLASCSDDGDIKLWRPSTSPSDSDDSEDDLDTDQLASNLAALE